MKLASKINSLYIRLYQDWKCCDSPGGGAHRHLNGLVKLLLREIDHRAEVEIIKGRPIQGAHYRSQQAVLRDVQAIIRDAKGACK